LFTDEANKTAVDTATAEKTSQKADTGLSAKAAANTDRPKQGTVNWILL